MAPVAVGLVGAGPWASMVHGPMLAAGPDTTLTGVWARRPEAAGEVARPLGVAVFERYEDLLEASEAVAFAVPPAVQAERATEAARRGKALLLEKPIAGDLPSARALVEAVDAAGVASAVVLSFRYAAPLREFLAGCAGFGAVAGRARFVSGALLGGMFATPWRLDRGPLLDLGPHVVDLLDAALGPVVDVRAVGDRHGWISLLLEHDGGAVSEAAMCGTIPVDPQLADLELYGTNGHRSLDCSTIVGAETFVTVTREFAAAVRAGATRTPLDVHRGLHLQDVLARAEALLPGG